MYTPSMRPYCPSDVSNGAINSEQEKEAWTPSSSSDASRTVINLMAAGLAFYSLLESTDIFVHQLVAMVAGLDAAYKAFCNALYEDTSRDLIKTQRGDLDTFMACNAGFGGDEPCEGFTSAHPVDALPVPLLYNESTKICIVWTGAYWGKVSVPVGVASYDSVSTCFGQKVFYEEEGASTERMRNPDMLADMIAMLLGDPPYLNAPIKRHTSNTCSVRRCNMFTLSMRPSASTKSTNLCVDFEQEVGSQEMSTLSDDLTQGDAFRPCFYLSLETMDTVTEQLGDTTVGSEGAYDMLVNNTSKQSDSTISRAPFGTADMFMQYIPRGIPEEQPDESSVCATPGARAAIPVMPVPKDLGRVIIYDGQHWSMDESPADIDTYNPGGICYERGIYCKGDADARISLQGDDLGEMLNEFLYVLAYFNTNVKMFVKNLESTQ